jgi:hypothetical protein
LLRFIFPLFVRAALLLAPATALAGNYPGAIPDLRVARGAKDIAEAWLADPTDRYRHFVLGARYEAATLAARLADGRVLRLTLPARAVFEDRQPRLADLDGDGRDEIIVVEADESRGAALTVIGVRDDRLTVLARGPRTGRAHTWLNPAGIADFDGDGKLDIAYVEKPHIGGRLRLLTMRQGRLVQIASLEDTSNHVIGSPSLGLAAVADFDGDGIADLAVPSLDRRSLRFVTFRGGPRELARKRLPAPAVADFEVIRRGRRPAVVVGLAGGKNVEVTF